MSSSEFVQRLNNLFNDITSHLAFAFEKIAPSRREEHIRRSNVLIAKLETFSDEDDIAVELLNQIRHYRLKLEIRVNKLCLADKNGGGPSKTSKNSQTSILPNQHHSTAITGDFETVPRFSGKAHHFAVYLTALEDLILYNPSLTARAKYRKIFYSLELEVDQLLLTQRIDPAEPDLELVVELLRKRYQVSN